MCRSEQRSTVGTEDKVKSHGELAVELMLEEDRKHEEYLYKRAVLEIIKELNEKWGDAIEKKAKEALVDRA